MGDQSISGLEHLFLKEYNGSGEDETIEDFLEQYDEGATVMGWAEAKKIQVIQLLFKGTAKVVLKSVLGHRRAEIEAARATNAERQAGGGAGAAQLVPVPPNLSWDELKQEITEALRIVGYDRIHRNTFQNRSQLPGERFADFAFTLISLARKGYPNLAVSQRDAMVFERLIEGSLPQFQNYLITSDITTLKAAIGKCQLIESLSGSSSQVNALGSDLAESSGQGQWLEAQGYGQWSTWGQSGGKSGRGEGASGSGSSYPLQIPASPGIPNQHVYHVNRRPGGPGPSHANELAKAEAESNLAQMQARLNGLKQQLETLRLRELGNIAWNE